MHKLLHAALCGALLLLPIGASAQVPKATLSSQISQQFPDNATGAITPATTRTFLNGVVNSFQQYAGVNAQVGTTYTIQASDYGQLVTFTSSSPVAVTLPQAAGSFATFNVYLTNTGSGAGVVTVTPQTSTIDNTTSFSLGVGQSVWIVSDGTNWKTWRGFGIGTVNSVAMTVPGCLAVTGSPITVAGTLAVTANGTSGGIPYFNSATTCASSAVLPANAVVLGGGAGSPPTAGTAPTTGQMFLGQATGPPLWQTQSGDVTFSATGASSLASVITAAGPVGSGTVTPVITYDAKGRLTTVTTATIAPPFTALTGSLACGQRPADTGDVTTTAGSCVTTLANIPTNVPAAGTIVYTNIAAPATPAAGKDSVWTDSTDLRLHDKNASGVIGTTVVANTGSANNFVTGVSTAGVVSTAQPAFTNISGTCQITQGCTGQTTAQAARSVSGLNVDSFTGHGQGAVTILATERVSGTNGAFTTSNTWTLPAASAVNAGQQLLIADFQGTVTATNTLVISRAGTDTINGGTSVTISTANGAFLLVSDGSSKWTAQAIGGGSVSGVSSFSGRSGAVSPQANDYGLFNVGQGATNCSITASVVTNNLTITMTDASGATPSASSPCVVVFRNAAIGTGSTATRVVTSATTLTFNAGSSLGTANGTAFRVWVEFFDTGTTAVLGASVQSTFSTTSATIYPLAEDGIVSTTACSACITATSAGTFYTTAALTSKPYRIAGYVEFNAGQTTAGTWANAPSAIHPFTSGTRKPGDQVRTAEACTTTGAANITSTTYASALSASITPSSTANLVKVQVAGAAGPNPSLNVGHLSIFRGTTAGPMIWSSNVANTNTGALRFAMGATHIDGPQTISSQTYTVAINGDGTNAISFGNAGDVSAPCFATLILEEIMGANDNLPDWQRVAAG